MVTLETTIGILDYQLLEGGLIQMSSRQSIWCNEETTKKPILETKLGPTGEME